MHIELRRFFENDNIKENFEYDFNVEDELISSPVHVRGQIKNSTGIVSLSAIADFTVLTQCAKCAEDISRTLSVPVDHFLIAHLNNEDNDEYILVEDMNLDLDSLVTEDIYLSFPTRFLCREDCKGLCPICGKNLNDGLCGCKKPIDPRLAALQQLLSDDDD